MSRAILVGLDFGTTTSSAMVASAMVACNSVTGRMELSQIEPVFQSDPVFTPLIDDQLDEDKLAEYLDQWLAPIDRTQLFGGGALLTGLAAQTTNAAAFVRQTRRYLNDAIIAIGQDPCLEAWLAFMGNSADLSRASPERLFVNLDIGGGTTSLAAGRGGEVLRTGSLFVGARHIQVVPGSYRIVRLSSQANALLHHLGIAKRVGNQLDAADVQAIVGRYVKLLERAVFGIDTVAVDPIALLHQQVPFSLPEGPRPLAVTLSGGVGQLAYAHLQGNAWPATTAFGDLGIDLALALVNSPVWRPHLEACRPTALGRATVYGLLRYNTQVSGNTLYLSDSKLLPLSDLMILGSVRPDTSCAEIERLLALAARTASGACLRVELAGNDLAATRSVAHKIRQALIRASVPPARPLVLLLRENLGKVFGQYVTDWGASQFPLIVVDEVHAGDVQFGHFGALREGVVPVSFYGMTPDGESP